ncbi:F-box/FBD/LRR-repeat protein At1g13570-like [Bidens hawaiensis]|uniref:F-box/FBD/LRR-repeat protein At1g13570-like n=1 Tax=Bidens hawaiensis TaxID=980011 RepID=UPI00404B2232
MEFRCVRVTSQALKRFLSQCPLLRGPYTDGFVARGFKLALAKLLLCVPLIRTLSISKSYMKYLCADASPHNLPTSLVHLKFLSMDVCLAKQNHISSVLCVIRSSPMLEHIAFQMYDNEKLHIQQTRTNFLDSENHPDLKLDHLETLMISFFRSLPFEMEFVKLVMTKSPVLKNVQIELNEDVSVDKELEILRDMLLLSSIPCSAKLTVIRPQTS